MMRSYRRAEDGKTQVKHLGCAEDYAFFLEACLTMWETTFDERWLIENAQWAADEAIRLFHDDANGGFFTTGSDAEELIVRPKDLFDNAVPSANSVLALELQRLALFTGRKDLEDVALGAMKLLRDVAGRSPLGFGTLLSAVDFYTGDAVEIVIVGPGSGHLIDAVHRSYWPSKVLIALEQPRPDVAVDIPLLEGRTDPERATAYVCRRGVCDLPVHDAESMLQQMAGH